MSMVKIQRGNTVIRVSEKSYEQKFKKLGYFLVGETKKAPAIEMPKEEPKEDSEVDIDSIPISDMNKEQLQEYAKKHNIDTSHARNVREAREIIRKAKAE